MQQRTVPRSRRHTEREMAAKVERARALRAAGHLEPEICRELGVNRLTLHCWEVRYGGEPEGLRRAA